ncbi:App1 family protein [Algibacter mikhailovii]|uniref:App1 family protein n=1 Tax=Algibacter mikhailovii TaxID=425498 RepID=UPI0024953A61|nr:App1 family protein [Algibacter mikhailovii]
MPFIPQISLVSFKSRTIISGLILNTPYKKKRQTGLLNTLRGVLSSYEKPLLKNQEITVFIDDNSYVVKTNGHAVFEVELNISFDKAPNVRVWYQEEELHIYQNYPIFFKYSDTRFAMISDIDDTILVSHTASFFKRIGVLSFIPPAKRKPIDFTQKLLKLVELNDINMFYVSKSERNLFDVLTTFIQIQALPKGVLFLTPYLNLRELTKRKKGKDFKLGRIEFILKHSSDKKFVLIGDDTQKDMEVYEMISRKYKNQIVRIYIHQTRSRINSRKQLLWKKLKSTFPNAVYFNESTDIAKEIDLLRNLITNKAEL